MALRSPIDRRRESDAIRSLWRGYHETGDQGVRNRLVLTLSPLVKQIVGRHARRLPRHCEMDDYLSCGLEALIRAIDRFEDDRGVTLEQFAWTRIHGAVIDESRRQDWAPRSLRAFQRQRDKLVREYTAAHGRGPSRVQVATALALPLPELRALEEKLLTAELHSLNMPLGSNDGEDDGGELVDTIPSGELRFEPEAAVIHGTADTRVLLALRRLSPRDREVAELLYVEDRSLREVGELLGVTESRVSQLNSRIKRTVRLALEREPAFAA